MRAILTIAQLTLHEAARRRILLAALLFGLAFLILFGVGAHFMMRDLPHRVLIDAIQRRMAVSFLTLAGLYAANFLTVMTAVLLPVDTLSGEIDSGIMQTLASKPIRRSEILLGKWLAFTVTVMAYLAMLAGGVLVIARAIGGSTPPDLHIGLPLMALEALVLVTLSIAGGTRLSTVTNGVMVFGFHGIAFVGGAMEQVGTFTANDTARYVGTIASLIMPSESLWQLAAHHMQPRIMSELQLTPFSPVSVASPAMVWWAVGYVLVVLAIALRSFSRRSL